MQPAESGTCAESAISCLDQPEIRAIVAALAVHRRRGCPRESSSNAPASLLWPSAASVDGFPKHPRRKRRDGSFVVPAIPYAITIVPRARVAHVPHSKTSLVSRGKKLTSVW